MTDNGSSEWFYVKSNGRKSNGITLLQLKQLISNNEISDKTLIWHHTIPQSQWTQIKSLPNNIKQSLNIKLSTKPNQQKNNTKSKPRNSRPKTKYSHSNSSLNQMNINSSPSATPPYQNQNQSYKPSRPSVHTSHSHSHSSSARNSSYSSSTMSYDQKNQNPNNDYKLNTDMLNDFNDFNNANNDQDVLPTRRHSMSNMSETTIPPEFPYDIADLSDLSPDHTPTPGGAAGYTRTRKNSDSLDFSNIARISDFTKHFTTDIGKRDSENDVDIDIKSQSVTHNINTAKKKNKIKKINTKIIRMNTVKGSPIPTNVTLTEYIRSYSDLRRDMYRDKLNIVKKACNERDARSLQIEKQHFKCQLTYQNNDLQTKEKFISSQIEYYTRAIATINKCLKSSSSLDNFIHSNINNKKSLKSNISLISRKNDKLKKQISEYKKFELMLKKSRDSMIEFVLISHKTMISQTKKLVNNIENIERILNNSSTQFETKYSQISRLRKNALSIPWKSLSTEGDINLHYDELHKPLYDIYKELRQQESKWFIDRANLREQCMIYRIYWKKYNLLSHLQNKLTEMKKREKNSNHYKKQLISELNDIVTNGGYDKNMLILTKKQSQIRYKEKSLREKENVLNKLKQQLHINNLAADNYLRDINNLEIENDLKQKQIDRANKLRYKKLIESSFLDNYMKDLLISRKKIVNKNALKITNLWNDMNQKKIKLRSLQFDTKQLKNDLNIDDQYDIDDDLDKVSNIKPVTATPKAPSLQDQLNKLQNDLVKEEQEINDLNANVSQQNITIKSQNIRIEKLLIEKNKYSLIHDDCKEKHDNIKQQYDELNLSIKKYNNNTNDIFTNLFDGMLNGTDKILKLDQYKHNNNNDNNDHNVIHNDMDVDDDKKDYDDDKDDNDDNVDHDDIGEHEPGTTPPNIDNNDNKPIINLITRRGSVTVTDHLDNLCLRNSRSIKKVHNDLKQIYDIQNDLDCQNTMLEIRDVMDSIRNDTKRLDNEFKKEKDLLKREEENIENQYKNKKKDLQKQREKQKKLLQKKRKKLEEEYILNRVSPSPKLGSNNNDNNDYDFELSDDLRTDNSDNDDNDDNDDDDDDSENDISKITLNNDQTASISPLIKAIAAPRRSKKRKPKKRKKHRLKHKNNNPHSTMNDNI